MKIVLASDHGGFELKTRIARYLEENRNLFSCEIIDEGCTGRDSVDYPDFAFRAVEMITDGSADYGILVCTTGIGMSMAANRFPGIRAALCLNPEMARMSRLHNHANVLALGASLQDESMALETVKTWLTSAPDTGDRHARRVGKLDAFCNDMPGLAMLRKTDIEIFNAVAAEGKRQSETLDFIASENHVSRAVMQATGSVLTNKYAEGYPSKRWYNGCACVDEAESIAIARARELFGAEHANVQPHCGSSANMAVYFAMLKPGDRILAMSLAHGGHLTHGSKVNFSGRLFDVISYGVARETCLLDYDALRKQALELSPRMIVAGASAYPRIIDFKRLREIADEAGAYLMVDMAHIAGLVAGGVHPSPVPYADFVTSTTHKTLRGPRSGLVLCRKEYAADIDKQVFPGIQGGPQMHMVAAKAVCFHEAMSPGFREYSRQVVENAAVLAKELMGKGLSLVSGGTDNHLMLVDLAGTGLTGAEVATALERTGIVANKNSIPFDQRSAIATSGVRLGTPAVTTRGMREGEMLEIADIIATCIGNIQDQNILNSLRERVSALASGFPVPC